jgi:cyclophilin family peptidyl-prolyl cis-trans isomerase
MKIIYFILCFVILSVYLHQKNTNNIKNIQIIKQIRKTPKKIKKAKPIQDLVFIDIGIDNKYIGKIIILLFSDVVPITCNNFRILCKNKSYLGSPFHRIINNFMIQGGDFTNGDGTGGKSIYGNKFDDENFDIFHTEPYLLSMANSGKNTNGSQFFITTNKTPHLDNKHVVFGKIITGFHIIDKLNKIKTDENDKPIKNVTIINCGTT